MQTVNDGMILPTIIRVFEEYTIRPLMKSNSIYAKDSRGLIINEHTNCCKLKQKAITGCTFERSRRPSCVYQTHDTLYF